MENQQNQRLAWQGWRLSADKSFCCLPSYLRFWLMKVFKHFYTKTYNRKLIYVLY